MVDAFSFWFQQHNLNALNNWLCVCMYILDHFTGPFKLINISLHVLSHYWHLGVVRIIFYSFITDNIHGPLFDATECILLFHFQEFFFYFPSSSLLSRSVAMAWPWATARFFLDDGTLFCDGIPLCHSTTLINVSTDIAQNLDSDNIITVLFFTVN